MTDFPQLATDASGRYVYAIWYKDNGFNSIIQSVIGQRIPNIHFPIEVKPKR